MPRPLILYGLRTIDDWSFEEDAAGTMSLTYWEAAASVNGDVEVSSAQYHSAGDGLPSAQSLRQNVVDDTAGNISRIRQRLDISDLPSWAQDGVSELAIVAMKRSADQQAARMGYLDLRFYQSDGSATEGTGTETTPSSKRRFVTRGDDWRLAVCAAAIPSDAAYVDIELVFDPSRATWAGGSHVWWDRVFCGLLADLERGFSEFDLDPDPGYRINPTGGEVEVVKLFPARTEIDLEISNVLEGTDEDDRLKRLMRWLYGSSPGQLAFWQDRDKHTNAERHFQRVVVDPRVQIEYPPGITRRQYELRLLAPREGH